MRPRDPDSFTLAEIEEMAERCRCPDRKALVFGIEAQALIGEALWALARERRQTAQDGRAVRP